MGRIEKMLLIVALLTTGCVSDNLTYLIACPIDNLSTAYPIVTVREGYIKRVGSMDLLYQYSTSPVAVLNGCEWMLVGDEMLDAPYQVVEAYGENMWMSMQVLRDLKDGTRW